MSEIISFSRYFPESHQKAGQPTYFVEKILKSLPESAKVLISHSMPEIINEVAYESEEPKYHTVRSGTRFKAGDSFSPHVWLDHPYTSNQVVFAPDISVKKTWSFDCDENGVISIDGAIIDESTKAVLARNDGLSVEDFHEWLILPCLKSGKPFNGQIICWSDLPNYYINK